MPKTSCRTTSRKVASTASKILRDKRFSPSSKKVAASALSQRADRHRK